MDSAVLANAGGCVPLCKYLLCVIIDGLSMSRMESPTMLQATLGKSNASIFTLKLDGE